MHGPGGGGIAGYPAKQRPAMLNLPGVLSYPRLHYPAALPDVGFCPGAKADDLAIAGYAHEPPGCVLGIVELVR